MYSLEICIPDFNRTPGWSLERDLILLAEKQILLDSREFRRRFFRRTKTITFWEQYLPKHWHIIILPNGLEVLTSKTHIQGHKDLMAGVMSTEGHDEIQPVIFVVYDEPEEAPSVGETERFLAAIGEILDSSNHPNAETVRLDWERVDRARLEFYTRQIRRR